MKKTFIVISTLFCTWCSLDFLLSSRLNSFALVLSLVFLHLYLATLLPFARGTEVSQRNGLFRKLRSNISWFAKTFCEAILIAGLLILSFQPLAEKRLLLVSSYYLSLRTILISLAVCVGVIVILGRFRRKK